MIEDVITITLFNGDTTVVDTEDASLAQYRWAISGDLDRRYAVRYVKGTRNPKKYQILHREVMERVLGRTLNKSEEVDHINGNTLDNRRGNLRLANRFQNAKNRRRDRDSSSGYKGVRFHKASQKWDARITSDGRQIFLGVFDTPEAAHEAYCEAARMYHGEFARTE